MRTGGSLLRKSLFRFEAAPRSSDTENLQVAVSNGFYVEVS